MEDEKKTSQSRINPVFDFHLMDCAGNESGDRVSQSRINPVFDFHMLSVRQIG